MANVYTENGIEHIDCDCGAKWRRVLPAPPKPLTVSNVRVEHRPLVSDTCRQVERVVADACLDLNFAKMSQIPMTPECRAAFIEVLVNCVRDTIKEKLQ
jgi:hypothetical protein